MAEQKDAIISVSSGVGPFTRQAFVNLEVARAIVQMAPDEARNIAMNLIEGAAAAEFDEIIVRISNEAGPAEQTDPERLDQAAKVLAAARRYRDEMYSRYDSERYVKEEEVSCGT